MPYQLVHGAAYHILGDNDRARNGEDGTTLLLITIVARLRRCHPDILGYRMRSVDRVGKDKGVTKLKFPVPFRSIERPVC